MRTVFKGGATGVVVLDATLLVVFGKVGPGITARVVVGVTSTEDVVVDRPGPSGGIGGMIGGIIGRIVLGSMVAVGRITVIPVIIVGLGGLEKALRCTYESLFL